MNKSFECEGCEGNVEWLWLLCYVSKQEDQNQMGVPEKTKEKRRIVKS